MAGEALIRSVELAVPAFVRDLRAFLSQNAEVLQAISETANGPEGFTGGLQAQDLNARFDISVNRATGCLRIAEYLYRRSAELGMDPDEAVNQIVAVAAGLEEPITIDETQRKAFADVVSFKRDLEVAMAVSTATSHAPHFIDVNGGWAIKPVTIRNGEVIKVPVVTLSLMWHDGPGNNHEAYLQMSERDWAAFNEKLDNLSKSRQELERLL